MPKLILRCNYLRNAPAAHLSNYMNYISTRDGVEKVNDTTALLPATAAQKDLIRDILGKITDAERMHEYYDYLQNPTRENASEFITQALENNIDLIAKKKNYIEYLANRPRVEKIGTHGLFSVEGEAIVLAKVAKEVAEHKGVVWTNVISLRKEDAEKLGYDSALQWQSLIRSRVHTIAENYKIEDNNLKWYAAFHNESHHPHVHLVVYSKNPSEGYLTKNGIENMRSTFTHDIFRQEFMEIYEKKTQKREQVKKQANESLLFLLGKMRKGVCHNIKIAELMEVLARRLQNTKGKKVYGYLKKDVKALVDQIIDELAKEEPVATYYREWIKAKNEIFSFYQDYLPEEIPLSHQKEFKSIKNMVITEAVRFGKGHVYLDDEAMETKDDLLIQEPIEILSNDVFAGVLQDLGKQQNRYSNYFAEWTDTYKEAREYLYGTPDVQPDEEAAYVTMEEEAKNGNVFAMFDMGKFHQTGIYVKPDQEIAREWYQKTLQAMLLVESLKEDPYVEYRLGLIYAYGMGTLVDESKAEVFFRKAMEHKNVYAQYQLAKLYIRQEQEKISNSIQECDMEKIKQAVIWLEGASQKKHRYADYMLGKVYRDDMLGIKDIDQAIFYLDKAATNGNQYAQYALGKIYLLGKEVPQDREKAFAYFTLAAEQGNEYAAYFLEHWNDMTHPDLLLMASRLLKNLERLLFDDLNDKWKGGRVITESKLRRKMKEKKIAQGHAKDESEIMIQGYADIT